MMIRWFATPGKTEILIQFADELLASVRQSLEDDAWTLGADIFVSEEAGTTTLVLQFKDAKGTESYVELLAGICPRAGAIEVVAGGREN